MAQAASTAQLTDRPSSGRKLAIPAEPVEIRGDLVRLASDFPGASAQRSAGALGDYLWELWGDLLESGGIDHQSFDEVVGSYERELWLWVAGERTWAQCAEGLAGRLQRRMRP